MSRSIIVVSFVDFPIGGFEVWGTEAILAKEEAEYGLRVVFGKPFIPHMLGMSAPGVAPRFSCYGFAGA